jgi:hypothetical protein
MMDTVEEAPAVYVPCPFCGETRVIATQQELENGMSGPFSIECICGAKGPNADTLKLAAERWDRCGFRSRKKN